MQDVKSFLKLSLITVFSAVASLTLISQVYANINTNPNAQTYYQTPAPNSGAGANKSFNWAGYVASSGTFTAISGTWVIPQSANNNYTADATWVGIGGVNSRDLIQAGTLKQGSAYSAWFETLPDSVNTVPLNVNASDSVTVNLNQQSANVWTISITDNSTGQNYSTTVAYNSSLSSAEWIEEMPSSNFGFIPLDNFGSINFTAGSATMNGSQVNIVGSGAQPMSMVNMQGQTLAYPSAIGSDNSSFTVTRTTDSGSVASVPTFAFSRSSYGFGHRGYRHGSSFIFHFSF